ncbi:MAG: glycine C-acetyltransferase [Candidatus Pacebacteria bacterium]|nr:glycine C-acetyltransferase [Candidatus Paceibacterota bacterium]
MYDPKLSAQIQKELENLKQAGKFKVEREIEGLQGPEVTLNGKKVLMFGSNNYLGLANHPEVVKAAHEGLDTEGYGLSSVRFISGTQTIHRELEQKLAKFLGTEDSILYSTNFMSNLGFFASIVNESFGAESWKDAIYSDALNHASIIDSFKLCNRERVDKRIYPHKDLATLKKMLAEDKDKGYRNKFIVTDGVFSMEGDTADLSSLVDIAKEHGALLFVDDAHGVGVLGATGRGTHEYTDTFGKIDVLSGTFGKALGGAVGGYVAGPKELTEFLRQKSRTYMFSNSVPPSVVMASIKALDILEKDPMLVEHAHENADLFRAGLENLGFKTLEGSHPIVPLMLGDAKIAQDMSKKLLEEGLYVVGLWFPVVPEGEARLRFQVSAAHSKEQLERALAIIEKVGKEMQII